MQFACLFPLTHLRQSPFLRWSGFYLVANICGQWSSLVNHDVLARKLCKSLRKTLNFHKEWKETWFPHVFVHKTRPMYTSAVARGAQHPCAWCAPGFVYRFHWLQIWLAWWFYGVQGLMYRHDKYTSSKLLCTLSGHLTVFLSFPKAEKSEIRLKLEKCHAKTYKSSLTFDIHCTRAMVP